MITLIIVDCQNDFITGTLSVKSAKNILPKIKEYIKNNLENIEKIILTADWHPFNHCSFKRNGGEWPVHCVQYTPGACIEPKLLKYIQSTNIPYEVSTKGCDPNEEQYGACYDIDISSDNYPKQKYYFDSIATANVDTEFVICGIAGDYCVKATIENLLNAEITPKVLITGIASIDGGKIINEFIKEKELEKVS